MPQTSEPQKYEIKIDRMEGRIDSSTIMAGDVNVPLFIMIIKIYYK